jgi:signal transduction histidine kinase
MNVSRSQVADALLAMVLAVASVGGTLAVGRFTELDRPVDGLALALAVSAALVLVVRRRWPLVSLSAAALASAYLLIGYPYGPIMLSLLVAVYTVARCLPLSTSVPAAAVALALLLAHLLTHNATLPGVLAVIPVSAWVVVPFAVGTMVRVQRESTVRAREESVRQRVYQERLRVAQEVHDVVGHGLAAIKMQADVALHVLARKPEQAEVALTAISRTSATALEELRATLAVVRQEDDSRSPAPGLDQLAELRDRMSQAGVEVRLDTTGEPRSLPAAVDLAGYRIVQESLTNVLRHSEAKVATVGIGYQTDALVITIANPVSGATAGNGAGLGIPGMRERVLALGGTFSAAPTADGRFEVRADIPTGGRQ